ncbi:hypothetical protein [Isoptericola dokdonensis]|uniref:Uncharacterized protein n=1 Tax=Isoptericola dokdonensis DS-3 TaxID=1300344 RepID=A0A161HYE5_9MICO|nr:hypothetical protein [Isoptericola dokdonensis]ANC31433.1 hypothetical protein I598_1885 [Isoptericola dokdonensis DS-3]
MIGSLLHPHTLIVEQVVDGPPDADGVATETVATREWGPCSVHQHETSETPPPTERPVERRAVSGPHAPWIASGDRLLHDGDQWWVEGRPAHFTGGVLDDHTELVMTTWG